MNTQIRSLGLLAGIVACLASANAQAAADDLSALPSPVSSTSTATAAGSASDDGMASAGRRLLDKAAEAERAAVAAVRDNLAGTPADVSWRLGANTPANARVDDILARARQAPPAAATVASDAAGAADPAPDRAAGLARVSLGARWRVLKGDADTHVPVVSWMADVQPAAITSTTGMVGATSSSGLPGTTALRPSVHLSAEWALPNDFSLGLMPGMAMDMDALGRRTATGTLAVTVGKSWSSQWRTFLDLARDRLSLEQSAGISTSLNVGAAFMASPTLQLDVALSHGLTMEAPPFQAGVGVTSSF